MSLNIEVELRGNLTEDGYNKIKSFFDQNAKHIESHEREMFLLRDYPGYTKDFVGRDTDIRLRNTSGSCEIMLKQKVEGAREEISLKLAENNLDNAKKVVKALGCKEAVWMHRLKEVYDYNGIEWSIVICPNNIRYYEAELVVNESSQITEAETKIKQEAQKLGLEVLDDEGTRILIAKLDKEANKVVEL